MAEISNLKECDSLRLANVKECKGFRFVKVGNFLVIVDSGRSFPASFFNKREE